MRKYTDSERLDFLQSLNDAGTYTGKCLLRVSAIGRGWRIHETSREDAHPSVRVAIDAFINGTRAAGEGEEAPLTEGEIREGRKWLDRKRKELGLRKRGDNGEV